MSAKPSVEMYLCAFRLGKWEADESVEEAYHRALDITAAQFHWMRRDDYGGSTFPQNALAKKLDRDLVRYDLKCCL